LDGLVTVPLASFVAGVEINRTTRIWDLEAG